MKTHTIINKRTLLGVVAGTGLLLATGCTRSWENEGKGFIKQLEGVTPIPGGHCESSAMLNALRYLGYEVSEEDIIVGGGAPSFLFTTGGFPFIGSRSLTMREEFLKNASIPYRVVKPVKDKDAWKGVYTELEQGSPVLLRVDMRYLPYLWGGKYGSAYMSFGWHYICLFGINVEKNTAYVSDTGYTTLLEVKISDLDKARSSKTTVFPPKYEYAVILPKTEGWKLNKDALMEKGLALIASNMDTKENTVVRNTKGTITQLSGLTGMLLFPQVIADIESITGPWILAPALSYMGASIEKNGTGGSGFRRFLVTFLEKGDFQAEKTKRRAAEILPVAKEDAESWTALALSLEKAGSTIQKEGKKADRKKLCAEVATFAEKTVKAEEKLYASLTK